MDNKGEIIIYQNKDNNISLSVRLEDENVWLTQQQMSELFQTSRTNVVEHIKHIFEEGELDVNASCRNFRQVQNEGNRMIERELPFYNLDLIISLGYRDILQNAGLVSHEQAVEKALAEYRKYQVKTLSPVEHAYLETIKNAEKKIGTKK